MRKQIVSAINNFGIDIEFTRNTLNEFKEAEGLTSVCSLKCVYNNKPTSKTKSERTESGQNFGDIKASILALKDIESDKIEIGDIVEVRGESLRVISVYNVKELDIYYTFTLEGV